MCHKQKGWYRGVFIYIYTSSHAQHHKAKHASYFFHLCLSSLIPSLLEQNEGSISKSPQMQKTQTEVHKPKPVNCIIIAKFIYLI